jgi:uncharacterized protein (DUF1778 family)
LTRTDKETLRLAAFASRQSINEFVLESALARAEEVLPDRNRFGLNARKWTTFQAALDAKPKRSSRLAKLLRTPSAFEHRLE